jgi:long-subunit acyl-CoA synthetase (AMP-forming)
LALGYCNQSQLSAERFIDHPLEEWRPGKVYRTGDRAFWRPDGRLEFVGRVDNQVKVRGGRVEIDSVENVLQQQPEVANAVVVCKEETGRQKYLVAYVESHASPDALKLRNRLRNVLPPHAVPDLVVHMERLPLTLNGKIDRRHLQRRNDAAADITNLTTSMTANEAKLLGVVEDVLERGNLTVDDDIFDAGANSLRVIALLGRVRDEFSSGIALMDIYACRTVRKLALRTSEVRS